MSLKETRQFMRDHGHVEARDEGWHIRLTSRGGASATVRISDWKIAQQFNFFSPKLRERYSKIIDR